MLYQGTDHGSLLIDTAIIARIMAAWEDSLNRLQIVS